MTLGPDRSPQRWNRFARGVITSGGLLLIAAVLMILVFIAREALPLFGKPRVDAAAVAIPPAAARALGAGLDDERRIGYEIQPQGTVFFRIADGETLLTRPHPFAAAPATCADIDSRRGLIVLGSADGRAAVGSVDFDVRWNGAERSVVPSLRWRGIAVVDSAGGAVQQVCGDRDSDGRIAMLAVLATKQLRYALLDEMGAQTALVDLSTELHGTAPTSVLVSQHAFLAAAGTADGTLYLWQTQDSAAPQLEDHVRVSPAGVTALRLLLGDQTLVVGTAQGQVSTWLRRRYVVAKNEGAKSVKFADQVLDPGQEATLPDRDYGRRFGHIPDLRFRTAGQPWTHISDFDAHTAPVAGIAAAPRGRSFATLDAQGAVFLRHSTTGRTLLKAGVEGADPRSLVFAPRGAGMALVSDANRLNVWAIDNPHPEASAGALFGKTWYEGYSEPKFVWQSTGGSDEFEPKLALVPLLVGTLKGTFYALLFSVPVAVFAALYLSQMASPGLRAVIKPVIELMAAMPSVVVGFLAALWLAPLLETHLCQTAGGILGLPLGLAVAVAAWYALPQRTRQKARPGFELAFLIPFLVLGAWLGAHIGGPLEAQWFGGDLKQWLFDHQGITYDQRNCIVVGIALGFAVVPIIFTISEDAMSAVPPSLTTAALALGASRWQSALHIVLPAASPGIFAAVMLGLGRAIGETMIVLMATGNTPILDFSIFNGMRTMSAGIAVEIPEAPHGGTLYRVLFLTGFLLFLFTFVLNTTADVIGRRLRKRYGQF